MFSFVWTYFQVEETEKTGNLSPVYAANAPSWQKTVTEN